MAYFVYILRSLADDSYYIGHTHDLGSRLMHHNQRRVKYSKGKRPWKLVYFEKYADRSDAMIREQEIKERKSRRFIDCLVRASRQS